MTTNLAVKLLVWFYSREGHLKTTALLLAHNAQVNVPSGSNDDTPLTLACWKGEAFSYYFFSTHSNFVGKGSRSCFQKYSFELSHKTSVVR